MYLAALWINTYNIHSAICVRYVLNYVVIIKPCTYAGPPGRTTMFQNVPSGWYSLRVTATSDMEEAKVLWKVYVPMTSSTCSVNLINADLVVDGTTVSMEFRGVGSTSSFTCRLDNRQFSSCELDPCLSWIMTKWFMLFVLCWWNPTQVLAHFPILGWLLVNIGSGFWLKDVRRSRGRHSASLCDCCTNILVTGYLTN